MPTVVKPLEYSKETLLGMTVAIEQRFGCTPRNDIASTLNTKFGVQASRLPSNAKLVRYFCWGVGGRTNDNNTLSSAQYVLGTNMSLYAIRPFRAVPLASDLTALERANYAMRKVQTIDGVPYVLYYLKKIDFTQSQVQYKRTDPVTGVDTLYDLDYSNLAPTAPVADANGLITDVSDSISVVLPGSMTITGQEVFESMSVIDGGDTRYSIVSELGFVSASTETVSAVNSVGAQFTYSEAILAQMVDQYNWVGQPFLSTNDTFTRTLNFTVRNIILP
jgi:hypothetical protein